VVLIRQPSKVVVDAYYLKAAYYSDLFATSSLYKLFLWRGMFVILCVPKDPLGYVYDIKNNSSVTTRLVFVDSAPSQTGKHLIYL